MSERFSPRLTEFLAYWSEKVKRGENSGLGGVEIMILEIYDNWLRANEMKQTENCQ